MVVKNSFLLVLVFFFCSFSEAKKEIVLEKESDIEKYIGRCSNSHLAMRMPDQDFIFYAGDGLSKKFGEPYLQKKNFPYIKFYGNKNFKGKALAELNRDGFFIEGEKKCGWDRIDLLEKNYEFYKQTGFCNLLKIDNDGSLISNVCCKELNAQGRFFPVSSSSDTYFELKANNRSYFLERKEAPQYIFEVSTNKATLKRKGEFIEHWNPSFRELQMQFISFFETQNECVKKNYKKGCGAFDVPFELIAYLCYENKIKCPKETKKWVVNEKIKNIYNKILLSCFNYEDMNIELTSSSKNEIYIYKVLKEYNGDLGCQFNLARNYSPKKSFNISFKFIVDVRFPTKENEELSEFSDLRDDQEYKYTKQIHTKRLFCDKIFNPKSIFPSRLHDKNLQKWE